jgi:hypothetical protein
MDISLIENYRYIVFRDRGTWYAVALEFNIIESSDNPKLAFFSLLQAVEGYIKSVKKIKEPGFQLFTLINILDHLIKLICMVFTQ